MAFDRIIGQEKVKRFFARTFEHDRVSHAYLFVGQSGTGKAVMAIDVAAGLLGYANGDSNAKRVEQLSHPDVHLVFPSPAKATEEDVAKVPDSLVENPYGRVQPWANPSISIEKIRDIRKKAAYKSFEGKGRVFIILDCDRLTVEASNALLKILEEPPEGMHLLMTSSRPSLLLPTITSRCQIVKFDPLSASEIESALLSTGVEAQKARIYARLADGSFTRALELREEGLDELQQHTLDFFRKSIQSSYLQVMFVEDLLNQFQRDAKAVREVLAHLLIWFRDALVYREAGAERTEMLILGDQLEVLKNFNKSFPNADLNGAAQEIERSLELMDRNVQVNLILIVLLNKLRAFVRR